MDRQQPARTPQGPRFGGKIDIGIYKELGFAAIYREEDSRLHLQRFRAPSRHRRGKIVRELQRYVRRKRCKHGCLPGIKKFPRIDLDSPANIRIGHVKIRDRICDVEQHHTPAETVLAVGPFQTSAREEMTQWEENLNRQVKRHAA